MIKSIQGSSTAGAIYYAFHVLGFIFVFLFNAWYARKKNIPIWKSILTTIAVYSVTYIWIYVLFWIESGFETWGGNNIVRGFVYIPLIAYPVSLFLNLTWTKMCDFIAPCVCLSHGISHIGCIFVGCCSGYPSSWGIYNYKYDGTAFPVQLFEAATALVIFAVLILLNKRNDYKINGKSYPIMLILFGTTRFLWEFARNNEKIRLGCSSLAFHALFMSLVGCIAYFIIKNQNHKTNKKHIEIKSRRK